MNNKKMYLFLIFVLLILFLTGCKNKKTPFDYFKNLNSYHLKTVITRMNGENIIDTMNIETWQEGNIEYTIASSSNLNSKSKCYYEYLEDGHNIYEYDYKTSTWDKTYVSNSENNDNKSTESTESTKSTVFKVLDINNYDYDKETGVYTIKPYIDTGANTDYKIYMDDGNVVLEFAYYDGTDNYIYKRTFSDFNEKFNLKLPS